MINQTQITDDWIRSVSKTQKVDPILVEKVIRALLLLEGLVDQKLPFVFKGGTALMLHFNSTKRLSIDVDILLSDKKIDLNQTLTNLVNEQGFRRWELQERTANIAIEKAHYKLFYNPARNASMK